MRINTLQSSDGNFLNYLIKKKHTITFLISICNDHYSMKISLTTYFTNKMSSVLNLFI